jgi:type I restriction enzyme R subunit
MMCISNVRTLIRYYEIFRAKKEAGEHKLNIATIFSYGTNEDDPDASGFVVFDDDAATETGSADASADSAESSHTRDKLEEFIADYNTIHGTKFTTKDSQAFYNYYNDIARRVKNREIDLLLVVNMFLTGFDSPALNTLFVDKNLRYHGLVQAYSRTNRIINELKSQGNIIVFRNLKKATDEAITLFSNKEAIEEIILQPIENYVEKFNEAVKKLVKIAPTIDSVNDLQTEEDELKFVTSFREVMRIKNVLTTFADFSFGDLKISEQDFEDYKSKYLDLYEKVRNDRSKEKVSILEDVDFALELIHRDEINVAYILRLLAKYHEANKEEKARISRQIYELLAGEIQLRSKRELILEFIDKNLPETSDQEAIEDEFKGFWKRKQKEAFDQLCRDENISQEKVSRIIGEYLFTERKPLPETIVDLLETKPKLLERKSIVQRITDKILNYVDVFINGISET